MHALAPLIQDLALILGLASITTILFQKIKQPVVLGYLIAGIIAGPHTFPSFKVHDTNSIQILSELGVIFLMFSLGLEFSFHKLKRIGPSASITGLFEVSLMLLFGYSIGVMLGWSFFNCLFLGAVIAISSTTIIIKALSELKLQRKRFAELVVGVLVIEDILAILLLVALSTIVATNNLFSIQIVWAAGKLLLVVGSWFLLGYFLVPTLFNKIKYYINEETLIVISIALCLIMVCVANYYHYSTALGAFIMGSILAETPLVHRIEHLVYPIRNIFAAVFFVSIGMQIDPNIIMMHFPIIAVICLAVMCGKLLLVSTGSLLAGQSIGNALRTGATMAQIGEFSFIIVGLGITLQVIDNKLYSIVIAVSAITAFTTPYLIKLSGFVAPKAEQYMPKPIKYILTGYTRWLYELSANKKGQALFSQAIFKLVTNSLLVIVIFKLSEEWLLPMLIDHITQLWLADIVAWLLTLAFSAPFIWGMLVSFQKIKPNSSKQTLRTTPVPYLLSWLLTVVEVTVLSLAFFEFWLIAILLFVIAIGAFAMLYKQLDKFYRWFERRLATNLKQNVADSTDYEKLLPWDSHLLEVEIPRQSPLIGKRLSEHQLRQRFGINIVAIYRGSNAILCPRGSETIFPLDKLIIIGHDEQLEQFSQHYMQQTEEAMPTDLLANFTLKPLAIDSSSSLVGKTIADSSIREQVKGLVVGIERQGSRILNPDSSTVLTAGDLLFIVGDYENLQAF